MKSGHLLNDRYKIKEKIGGGGMANVYLARDIILDRDVAVKALRTEYIHDAEFIARFDREAQSASSLSHPNVVNIYDVGEEEQLLYMVMEYVDGMTLKEYIQHYGPIDVHESLDIMKQITSAISHAHANDIVHRDIKPQNILINRFGQIKVTDFGIAIALSATSLTQTNSILGSVHYLSPEQARGGTATKKSDIYSMGIVLFELLTGRLPFSGQSPVSVALKHLQSSTPSVRRYNQDIPQSVENIVLKATAKDPFHRYETIYTLEDALETALDPDRVNEPPYEPPVEAGEETKAIPIITGAQMEENLDQATLVHQFNDSTREFNDDQDQPAVDEEDSVKKANGKKKKKTKKGKNGNKTSKKNKKAGKEKKGKKKWLIALFVLFFLLAAAVAALLFVPGLMEPEDVEVPDVTELTFEEAKELLEAVNFEVEEESIISEEIEEGYVVKTNPAAGRTVKAESTVTVFVSAGKEKVEFGDYVGRDFTQVERLLEEAGYTDIRTYDKHSDRPSGEIISQIQPMPGTEVIPADATVIFEVSIGPELVNLTNLAGMPENEAREYLDSNGLRMNAVEENSDSQPAGEVIRQDPGPGARLEVGTTVNVYISRGPEEQRPLSHRVSYTVTYTADPPPEPEEGDEEVEETEPVEQIVRIYIGDMNHNISEVYEEKAIKGDEEFTFTLTIAPNSNAEYRITRDDEEVTSKSVSYEEEEG